MPAALVSVGAFGFCAQLVLVRELLSVFAGNELSIGVMVGAWIVSEAAGALAGAKLRVLLGPAALLSVIAALLAVPAAMLGRRFLGALPGEAVGLDRLGLAALAIILLPAGLHGLSFSAGARELGSGGRAYLWESLGTAVAALLAAAGLVFRVPSPVLLGLIGLPVCVSAARPGRRRLLAGAVAVGSLCIVAVVLARPVERWCYSRLWAGQRVLSVADSPYGRVVTLERTGQLTVAASGVPVFTAPALDPGRTEELVHVPLLAHPAPRRVLLVGQARGGPAAAALAHRADVTAVQLDPVIDRATSRFALAEESTATFATADPRRFLAADGRWDAIILLDAVPQTLAGNRLFTREFFSRCRSRLAPGGLLAVPAPGSASALSADVAAAIAVRRRTIGTVFDSVALVWLDFPLLLAGGPVSLSSETLAARLRARAIQTVLLDSGYAASLLDRFRQRLLSDRVPPGDAVNSDLRPIELFLGLVREQRLAAPAIGRWYRGLARHLPKLLLLGAGLLLATLLAGVRTGRRRFAAGFAVATSGFAASAVSVLALLGFQVRFGSVYAGVALLLGAFMTAAALGAWSGRRAAPRLGGLALTDLLLLAVALGLPGLAVRGPAWLFAACQSAAGFAVGSQFARASRLLRDSDPAASGRLFALDLAGGFLGSVVVSAVLVPVAGMIPAALTAAGLKAISLAGLALARAAD